MKLFKIFVQENKRPLPTGEILYDEVNLTVFEELERDQQMSIMQEYTREKGKNLRIGALVEGAAKVVAKDSWGNEIRLSPSSKKTNIWYEASRGWIENGFEERKESIFGINACGEWTVIAYGIVGNILSFEKVKIIPSMVTPEQYTVMQMEVKKLFEELAYQPTEKDERAVIRELQIPLFPLERFRDLLNDWNKWLQQIELSPAEMLHSIRERKNKQHVKKWDAKSLLEAQMFSLREKISVKTYVKDSNIPEHRMIKWMLERIRERIVQERATENSALLELTEIQRGLDYLNTKDERNIKVMETLRNRKQQLQRDINLLAERLPVWDASETIINSYLNCILFDIEEMEPEWTHLFTSHPVPLSIE